jgi:putative effector of murein hydrolase LrgA (UPF0299 family)
MVGVMAYTGAISADFWAVRALLLSLIISVDRRLMQN